MPRELRGPLAVGTLLRMGLAWLVPVTPAWDGAIYARAAIEIAAGRGYTWRVLREGAEAIPTAFYPVGFPAWLAGLRWIGITGTGVLVVQALLCVTAIPIAWRIARRLGGRAAGVRAAWLAALWPGGVLYALTWMTEPLFMALVGVSTVIALSRRGPWARSAWAGLWLGLAAWVRPTALPIAVLMGAGLGRGRRAVATALVSIVIALAVIAPWSVRNEAALGAPVLASTNAGFNLLLGTLGRGAFGHVPEGIDCDRALAEVEKDRCRRGRALERIADDPLGWAGLGVLKVVDTFGHESAPAHYVADATQRDELRWGLSALTIPFWMAVMILAMRGAWRARHRRALRIVLAPILGIAITHFVFIGGDRYHAAVAPMILALAAIGWPRAAASRLSSPNLPSRGRSACSAG